MGRLLAGIVVIVVIGVAIETQISSAADPGRARSAVGRVAVTRTLKRMLQSEISTLRAAQPTAPRAMAVPRGRGLPIVPEQGVTCFVAGGSSRCPEIPCREFASAPAVLRLGSTAVIRPGASRKVTAPACRRHAPRILVLVSGP